ncbi:MAG TPA: hypothetical protein VEZ70_07490 [Allosphingosinicella sp.]|nr:hypothetical protein [Allosphingosinicella sp.]
MSFEKLGERARRLAEARAGQAARRIAAAAEQDAPAGVRVEAVDGGVRLSGRNLARRIATDPALRWLIERVR